jgi:hypothetical protein
VREPAGQPLVLATRAFMRRLANGAAGIGKMNRTAECTLFVRLTRTSQQGNPVSGGIAVGLIKDTAKTRNRVIALNIFLTSIFTSISKDSKTTRSRKKPAIISTW